MDESCDGIERVEQEMGVQLHAQGLQLRLRKPPFQLQGLALSFLRATVIRQRMRHAHDHRRSLAVFARSEPLLDIEREDVSERSDTAGELADRVAVADLEPLHLVEVPLEIRVGARRHVARADERRTADP